MKKWTMTVLMGLATLLISDVTPAFAQPTATRTFINASFGLQATSRTEEGNVSYPLYDETAVFAADTEVGSGPFFDVNVARRIGWQNLIIAGGFSYFTGSGDAAGTASIPSPLFFNQPALIPISGEDLSRSELGFHFSLVFLRPISDKMDFALSAGPSIYRISQELLSGTVAAGTQNMTPTVEDQSGTGVGLNVGGDFTYLLNPQMGIGILARYTWAPVDLDSSSMTAGGFQIGAGIRIRM